MTATSTTTEILTIGPPPHRRWGVVVAAGLVVLAAVALSSWPTNSAEIETRQIVPASGAVPPWAPAEPQQEAPALRQAHANWNAATIDRPTAYMQFCRNSPTLCDPTAPTPDPSYIQFCWNSPSLCTINGRY
jgi:hypothetical protein